MEKSRHTISWNDEYEINADFQSINHQLYAILHSEQIVSNNSNNNKKLYSLEKNRRI